jgi:hypothetical protein
MAVYEPIMNALLAYLQAQTNFGTVNATFQTMQRGIVLWERLAEIVNGLPVVRQPALFLYDGPEFGGGTIEYERKAGRADPPVRIMKRTIVIYARSSVAGLWPGGQIGGLATQNTVTSQANMLHPLVEAIETALNTPDNPETGTLTLGGLVAYCRHEGGGIQIPPDIDPNGQGLASMPLLIKIP